MILKEYDGQKYFTYARNTSHTISPDSLQIADQPTAPVDSTPDATMIIEGEPIFVKVAPAKITCVQCKQKTAAPVDSTSDVDAPSFLRCSGCNGKMKTAAATAYRSCTVKLSNRTQTGQNELSTAVVNDDVLHDILSKSGYTSTLTGEELEDALLTIKKVSLQVMAGTTHVEAVKLIAIEP